MGNCTFKSRQINPIEENPIPGLLPIENLSVKNYKIENLVFADGSMEGFSYAGAVSVLERLGILRGVNRFAGVGTGAIVAALLALGFNSKEIFRAANEYLNSILSDDDDEDDIFKNFVKNYGCISSTKFTNWFVQLLESKSFDSQLNFSQLYQKTGKELCVVVTNVDKLMLEYCHPKTTPDMPIQLAVPMSLSTPGIFTPIRYGPRIEKYNYVNGSLMCNYPIHSFDGWWLSMNAEDFILDRLETLDHYLTPDKLFNGINGRTLGFFRIGKHQETLYKEFVDRLIDAGADLQTPSTTLGERYNTTSEKRLVAVEKITRFRKACNVFMLIANALEDEGKIPTELFAWNLANIDWISQDDWVLLFPEFGGSYDDLNSFLSSLIDENSELSKSSLQTFLQNKFLSLLDDYSMYYKNNITNLQTYSSMVFNTLYNNCTKNLTKSDSDRSVGILCGHIEGCDVDLEDADQTFLYRQGWNATVSYFYQIDKRNLKDSEDH